MAGIVWLASYPKSGNTWLRAFLERYHDPARPVEINHLRIWHAAHFALFDLYGVVEVSELSDEEVEALRPRLYRLMASGLTAPVFLKVHDAFDTTADGVPLFPPDATQAVVYVIRNPCDVAVSVAHHFGTSLGEAVSMLCREEVVLGDRTAQCRQRVRSWSGHAKSWIDESGLPVCAVRYEDLLAHPLEGFARVLASIRVAVDRPRLLDAIEHSRFDRLQTQERTAGFFERSPQATAPFFRSGRSGDWRHHLTPDLVRCLVDTHGEVMRRFGYLTPAGEPTS